MANKKSGLGKGLGQLFLENSVDELVANNTLPLEEIVPNNDSQNDGQPFHSPVHNRRF